jgi:hypothetical protein
MEILNTIAQIIGYGAMISAMLIITYILLTTKKTYGKEEQYEEPIYTESEVQNILKREQEKNR